MKKQIPSLERLYTALLAGTQTEHYLDLRFGECRVRVLSNSKRLISKLRFYYRPFLGSATQKDITLTLYQADNLDLDIPFRLREPSPNKSKIKEEYCDLEGGRVVRKRLTGLSLLFGGGTINLAFGQCLENESQVINFINNRYIEYYLSQGGVLGHSSAVRFQGKGVAIAGFSGMGKSTLALHLMSKGADFVSNDRLLSNKVENQTWMRGVPKLPRINPGTALNNKDLLAILSMEEISYFSRLPRNVLWQHEQKFDVFLHQCFRPGHFILESPMDYLFILNWQHQAGPTEIHPVSLETRQDLLRAFMKEPGLFYQPGEFSPHYLQPVEDYLHHLDRVTVYEITGSVDFKKAERFISRLCGTGSSQSRSQTKEPVWQSNP